MSLIQIFLKELELESKTTRKMLGRIPDDKYDWKPHEKSMNTAVLQHTLQNYPPG
jgi:cobyric acid synthase